MGSRLANRPKAAHMDRRRPNSGLKWPKTFHLYVICHGKRTGPGGYGTQGVLASFLIILGLFSPFLGPESQSWPVLSRQTATDCI